MRLLPPLSLAFAFFGLACASNPSAVPSQGGNNMPADLTTHSDDRENISETLFGQLVHDPYRWLEDITSMRTKAWVDTESAKTRERLDALPHHDALSQRFRELFYLDTLSPPLLRGAYKFWSKREKTAERAVVWVEKKGEKAQILFDPNSWENSSLGQWVPSHDGRFVAYKVKENNADEAIIKIRDVQAQKDLDDSLEGAKYADISWRPDGKGFFYVYLPPLSEALSVDMRPGAAEARFHYLGDPQSEDVRVFPPTGNPQRFMGISMSRDGDWLFLVVQRGWNNTDIWVKDARIWRKEGLTEEKNMLFHYGTFADEAATEASGTEERVALFAKNRGFQPLLVGRNAVSQVSAYKGQFYVLTNDKAPRYRVLKIDPQKPLEKDWTELIKEGENPIESLDLAGGKLLLSRLENAANSLSIYDLNGKNEKKLPLPQIGSLSQITSESDLDRAYFTFTSFNYPPETFELSMKTGKFKSWNKVEIPVKAEDFEVKQVFYPSKDGTPISMFIVHQKGIDLDGSHPTLLYGYGGFNVSLTPAFAGSVAAWLEMGGVYAVPNLRGGGEYGEAWHEAGMRHKKQNVFDDFIAAAEYLIEEGYTQKAKLAIRGGSNGGLLVGAAMTQRPDLFQAVICAVPLLDMVRYHLYGSGRTWIPEYGDPEIEADFKTLYAYSPYHHIQDGTDYPSLLMLGADADDRVDPMHARKFTAAMQWAKRQDDGKKPALFRLEENSGHGGADRIEQSVLSFADQYAYLAWQLGMKLEDKP